MELAARIGTMARLAGVSPVEITVREDSSNFNTWSNHILELLAEAEIETCYGVFSDYSNARIRCPLSFCVIHNQKIVLSYSENPDLACPSRYSVSSESYVDYGSQWNADSKVGDKYLVYPFDLPISKKPWALGGV